MIGFFTQNIRNLFVKSFSKQRHWGDTLSILCVKIFEANCANILGNSDEIKNNRRCHLWCTQNLCKVDMTAGNNSDWLMRTLMLVTLWGGGRLEDPCVRLFFAGCFLLLPCEKEKPDTQARVQYIILFSKLIDYFNNIKIIFNLLKSKLPIITNNTLWTLLAVKEKFRVSLFHVSF